MQESKEQCPLCKKTFTSCVALNIHCTKKHNKKRARTDSTLKCPCGQVFKAKWRQNCVHKLNTHGRHCKAFKNIEMRCDVCKKGFIARKSLEFHCLKAHKLAVPSNCQDNNSVLTLDEEEMLIELYRNAPLLWDAKHKDFKNKVLQEKKLKEISELLSGHSIESIKRAIKYLKSTFLREVNLHEIVSGSESYASSFRHFEKLRFLKSSSNLDKNTHLTKSSTEEIDLMSGFSDDPKDLIFDVDVDIDIDDEIIVPDCSQSLLESSSTSSLTSNFYMKSEDYLEAATRYLDDDEEMDFARSLASTLRKFDRVEKELIKLEIQRIIVKYTIDQEGEDTNLPDPSLDSFNSGN